MRKIVLLYLFCLIRISAVTSQNVINPSNLKVDKAFAFPEKYTMNTFFVSGSQKIPLGKIHTSLVKTNDNISITTIFEASNIPGSQYIDSTVVNSKNFKPIHHTSKNPMREMVFNFGEKITGYYKVIRTGKVTEISETKFKPVFDSNSYPYIIRLLPLTEKYTTEISIFDFNPKSKVGIMKVSIVDTKTGEIDFNGEKRKIWEVKTTSDISENKFITTFFIDKLTKKTLKQITENEKGQLVMELESLN